jgi:hypothetical protein
MSSPSISLEQKNGQMNNLAGDFAEITYLDEDGFVARISDGTSAWQVLTEGAVIYLDNGVYLDLSSMQLNSGIINEETGVESAVMTLASIAMNSGSNIQVTNNTADSWIAPTFIINPVNGSNGISGVQGNNGDTGTSGENGKDGEIGEAGVAGDEGASGAHGAAATDGDTGEDGKDGSGSEDDNNSDNNTDDNDETEVELNPCITISSWSQTAGSFAFKFTPYNTSQIEEGTLKIILYNSATGQELYSWEETELTRGASLENGAEYSPPEIDKIALEPETTYKLIFEAGVLKTETSSYGKSILLTRTFMTDANGFYLEKVESEYFAGSEDLEASKEKYADAMRILNLEDLDTLGTHGFLGLHPVVSGGQEITGFSDVRITYVDENGVEVESTDQRLSNPLTTSGECAYLVQIANNDLVYPLDNLLPDTEYTISMTVEIDGTKTEQFTETYRTLKATPDVYYGCFTVNAGGYFESYVDFTQKDDPNDAILYYTHKVYAWSDESKLLYGNCLKTKISYDTSDPRVNIYLESTNEKQTGKIAINNEYGTRIYVTWFDNEKYVTKEIENSPNWSPAKIESNSQPKVMLTNVVATSSTLTAELAVVPNGGSSVSVGSDDLHRLHVQIASSNKTEIIYYTDLSAWRDSLDGTNLSNDNGTVIPSTGGYTTLNLSNLSPGTRYTITVTGILDGEDGSSEKVQLGSATFITATN